MHADMPTQLFRNAFPNLHASSEIEISKEIELLKMEKLVWATEPESAVCAGPFALAASAQAPDWLIKLKIFYSELNFFYGNWVPLDNDVGRSTLAFRQEEKLFD